MPAISFADLPTLAAHLRDVFDTKKFALIYAYNRTGKTRLCGEFRDLGKRVDETGITVARDTLYFSAFTEDLFSWDNDLTGDRHRFLRLNVQSEFLSALASTEFDTRIRALLDRYADFDFRIDSEAHDDGRLAKAEVVFFRDRPRADGSEEEGTTPGIKISRGEESIFVWCFFLAVLQLTLDGHDDYQWVKYVYIDDPISSLDEHNAIVVGNHLVQLYREARRHVPAVISTHHALFFNVLHYEIKNHFGRQPQFMLKRDRTSDGYVLDEQKGDTPQFYHVSALSEVWELAKQENVSTYHFNVLRSILEKTAFFHGYGHFSSCIKTGADDAEGILRQRFVDILSHGKYSMYEPTEMQEQTRDYFRAILRGFVERHPFNPVLLPEDPA